MLYSKRDDLYPLGQDDPLKRRPSVTISLLWGRAEPAQPQHWLGAGQRLEPWSDVEASGPCPCKPSDELTGWRQDDDTIPVNPSPRSVNRLALVARCIAKSQRQSSGRPHGRFAPTGNPGLTPSAAVRPPSRLGQAEVFDLLD